MNHSNIEVAAVSDVSNRIMEIRDQRDMKMCQLNALLATFSGEGFETFSNWNDDIQDNLLWLASTLAKDIDRLVSESDELQYPRLETAQ